MSDTLKKALDDLERLEFSFTIDDGEASAKAKRIEGTIVAHLRGSNKPN